MVEKRIRLGCSGDLFLRPAGEICKMAMQYRCRSELVIGDKCYNLRSVLSVLSAQANTTKDVLLHCDGTDESDAVEALARLLEEPESSQSE